MPITGLSLTDIGPFDQVTFEFDRQVNVFTGPNNSGKTAALLVLAELLVYPFRVPEKLYRSRSPGWSLTYAVGKNVKSIDGNLPASAETLVETLEDIGYTCFLPAQRIGTDFRASGPSANSDVEARIDEETSRIARLYPAQLRKLGFDGLRQMVRKSIDFQNQELKKRRRLISTDASLVDDRAIVQKIVDLDYAAYRQKRPEIRELIQKIVSMVAEITEGFPMTFVEVGEDESGLFPKINTPSGDLALNVLSQGTQSIVQCLARLIFGYAEYLGLAADIEKMPGVLLIDDIDAHLHPSWQRRIIPTLIRHFPKLQIFCSTHSPLMLAGLKAGQVQLLRRGEDSKLTVSRNESDIAGGTADEILRNFLEVTTPTDMATAGHVSRLQELRHKDELTVAEAGELRELRRIVGAELLAGPMSAQVEQFAEEMQRARSRAPVSSVASTSLSRTGRSSGKRD